MRICGLILSIAMLPALAAAQALRCNLQNYKPLDGLKAEVHGSALQVDWQGERGETLRAQFTLRDGVPTLQELAARKPGGQWVILGRDLQPEFQVTSGKRRIDRTMLGALKHAYGNVTQAMIDQQKWNTFWDAPLNVPETEGGDASVNLPRSPNEIHRAWASFHSTGCEVKTEGARLEISFPGADAGIFSGRLQYTVYRGSNLLRQEMIARTEEPSVAYKYTGGLKGFGTGENTRLIWRDPARAWQEYDFGGAPNQQLVGVRARNRLGIVQTGGGSLAFFPPPHKFFFARENEVDPGYIYYRKDSATTFAIGARQPDHTIGYAPYGLHQAMWEHSSDEAWHQTGNFALYNAPPGTWQRMAVYFYLSPEDGRSTQHDVMAYTHDDVFKPLPGFKVLVSHFHFHLIDMLGDQGTVDYRPPFLEVFRALGINIVILADFHGDAHPDDPGPARFKDQKVYFESCARMSDRNFLLIPGEEPNAWLGGHYMMLLSHPVYWSHAKERLAGQSFEQDQPPYGKVYHTASAADIVQQLKDEDGLVWQAHPRTKGSGGYPDAIHTRDYFLSDRFIGASFESLPVDLSQGRLCPQRCLDTMDDMSNWAPKPKFMIAEGDTYQKYPSDETYPQLAVNYVRLDRVPNFDQGWAPVVSALHSGNYFVTTGEVLFHNWGIEGSGAKSVYTADVEWTFPLEFAELVWSDGSKVQRKIIPATDLPAFGSHRFRVPFDPMGKKWVRFAVWDSAGDGGFTEPVALK
ncbi:MAG TPA: hypothetical protein VFQ24_12070 [Terriglobia bacterium]|nr:hypothetical protein [Terriglobia bacterium]